MSTESKLIEELNKLVHEVEHAAWDVGGNYVAKRIREILEELYDRRN